MEKQLLSEIRRSIVESRNKAFYENDAIAVNALKEAEALEE